VLHLGRGGSNQFASSDSGHESSGSFNTPHSGSDSDIEQAASAAFSGVFGEELDFNFEDLIAEVADEGHKRKRNSSPSSRDTAVGNSRPRGAVSREDSPATHEDKEAIIRKSRRRAEWHRRQNHQRQVAGGLQEQVESLEEENRTLASQIAALLAESASLKAGLGLGVGWDALPMVALPAMALPGTAPTMQETLI